MWKKLALAAAVASAVRQLVRQWRKTDARARSKTAARTELQRWEDEGGNLSPKSETKRADTAVGNRAASAGSRSSASAPF